MARAKSFEEKQQELEHLRQEARKVAGELLDRMTRDQLKRYINTRTKQNEQS